MVSGRPLKGLSNDEAEALRVCMAVQPARAMGMGWAVHERAIARVVLARAGIVDAGGRGSGGDGGSCEVDDVEVLASQEPSYHPQRLRRDWLPWAGLARATTSVIGEHHHEFVSNCIA